MAGAQVPIHGRDHCPGGPDPIPCLDRPVVVPWGVKGTGAGAQTLVPGTGTLTTITMAAGGVSTDQTDISTATNGLEVNTSGMYWCSFRVNWISLSGLDGYTAVVMRFVPSAVGGVGVQNLQSTAYGIMLYPDTSAGDMMALNGGTVITLRAEQNSGGDIYCIGYMQVVRIGDCDVPFDAA